MKTTILLLAALSLAVAAAPMATAEGGLCDRFAVDPCNHVDAVAECLDGGPVMPWLDPHEPHVCA